MIEREKMVAMTPYLKWCFIMFIQIFLDLHDRPASGLCLVSYCHPSAATQPIRLSTTPENITSSLAEGSATGCSAVDAT